MSLIGFMHICTTSWT